MVTVRHFAELENNIVVAVLTVAENDCLDSSGNFQEVIGENICRRLKNSSNEWIECAYTSDTIRKNPCFIGCAYDKEADAFWNPKKDFESWVLDNNLRWVAPVPKPDDIKGFFWVWDESSVNWVSHANDSITDRLPSSLSPDQEKRRISDLNY